MSTVEIKYDCQPHDGTAGQPWDDFEERLLDVASGRSDKRGWSLADCLMGIDEGGAGAGAPAIPGGAAGNAAQTSFRRRQKDSYSLLAKHELDADLRQYIHQNHFQDGPNAFAYLQGELRKATDRLQLKEMDKQWDGTTLLGSVGVQAHSISDLAKKLKALNARRPVANRKTANEIGDKILEEIFQTSKHFSVDALKEYNALPAAWQFAIAPTAAAIAAAAAAVPPLPAPLPTRDVPALVAFFDRMWEQAVNSKLPGFHVRAPAAKPSAPMRTTLEAGLILSEGGERAFRAEAGSDNFVVPRSGSPGRTLALLADAGDDLAGLSI